MCALRSNENRTGLKSYYSFLVKTVFIYVWPLNYIYIAALGQSAILFKGKL